MNIRLVTKSIGLIANMLLLSKLTMGQGLYFIENQEQKFVERIQTLYGHNGDTFQVNAPMSSMADAYNMYQYYKTDVYNGKLSNADIYRLNQYMIYNSDLSASVTDPLLSIPQYFGTAGLYINSPFLLEKKGKFNFLLQPVFSQTALYDFNQKNTEPFYHQSYAGLYSRMSINNRLALQLNVVYKNERLTDPFSAKALEFNSVPGFNDNYNNIRSGNFVSSVIPAGQLTYDIIPSRVNVSVGYDNLHIGEGLRSLILDRNGAPIPYLSVKTKIWKLDYTNIFIKAESQNIFDDALPQAGLNKYVAIHHLGINIGKKVNIGLFETITSSRQAGPELSYFNPAIFYRALERHLGSPDKMAIGLSASVIPVNGLKLYSQFFLNEFILKEIIAGDGYLHNKWGLQLGVKYYDMARIDNLDGQLEVNIVRPYAYQHRSNSNYSHMNLPLAHPLGANFKEMNFRLNYTPIPRFSLSTSVHRYKQGKDINDKNYGGNILKDIRYVPTRYNVGLVHGEAYDVLSVEASLKYEILPQLFFEVGGLFRKDEFMNTVNKNMSLFSGVQFHFNRRDWLLF